jgi:hypothetical protein
LDWGLKSLPHRDSIPGPSRYTHYAIAASWDGVEWIELAPDRGKLWALFSAVINVVSLKGGEFID